MFGALWRWFWWSSGGSGNVTPPAPKIITGVWEYTSTAGTWAYPSATGTWEYPALTGTWES